MKSEMFSAIASAFAACFSATAAWLMWSIQRKNTLNSIRPEIVLEGWQLIQDGEFIDTGEIKIQLIRNIGVGAAKDVLAELKYSGHNAPFDAGLFSFDYKSILSAGGSFEPFAEGKFTWKYVSNDNIKMVPLDLVIYCSDFNSNRYKTHYLLVACKGDDQLFGAEQLAPGLYLTQRHVTVKSQTYFWWLRQIPNIIKLINYLKSIKFFSNKRV